MLDIYDDIIMIKKPLGGSGQIGAVKKLNQLEYHSPKMYSAICGEPSSDVAAEAIIE